MEHTRNCMPNFIGYVLILIEIGVFEATARVDLQGTTTANTHGQLKISAHAHTPHTPHTHTYTHTHRDRCRGFWAIATWVAVDADEFCPWKVA